jgi:hypothetical protein
MARPIEHPLIWARRAWNIRLVGHGMHRVRGAAHPSLCVGNRLLKRSWEKKEAGPTGFEPVTFGFVVPEIRVATQRFGIPRSSTLAGHPHPRSGARAGARHPRDSIRTAEIARTCAHMRAPLMRTTANRRVAWSNYPSAYCNRAESLRTSQQSSKPEDVLGYGSRIRRQEVLGLNP